MKRTVYAADNRDVDRFIGLALGGAKSDRTSIAVIDYYKKQHKAFLIDIYDTVGAHDDYSSDEVLLEIFKELSPSMKILATDVPLTLPPCALGCEKSCKGISKCKKPAVKWMWKTFEKLKDENPKLKHFTPYTQRPIDLFVRDHFPTKDVLQDETLGSNLAPQTMRMQFLKSKLSSKIEMLEVWPKLVLYHCSDLLDISEDEAQNYRSLEDGALVREKVVDEIIDSSHLFIYERDIKKLISNVHSFEALICAWVAMKKSMGQCIEPKSKLPLDSGWITLPKV